MTELVTVQSGLWAGGTVSLCELCHALKTKRAAKWESM